MNRIKTLACIGLFLSTVLMGENESFFFQNFSPKFEGTFLATLKCQPQDPSRRCKDFNQELNLIVFNALTHLRVELWGPTKGEFYRVQFRGTNFENLGESFQANSQQAPELPNVEIQLAYEKNNNGEITGAKGWLRSPEFRFDVRVTARILQTPGKVLFFPKPTLPIAIPTLVGDYVGYRTTVNNIQVPIFLSIRPSLLGDKLNLTASFIQVVMPGRPERPPIVYDFATTYLDSNEGILHAVADFDKQNSHQGKFTFYVIEGAKGDVHLKGYFSFQSLMTVDEVVFNRKP